jgi:hypothetical protein
MYDKSDFGGWKSQVPPGQYMFNELDKKEPWKNDEVRAQACQPPRPPESLRSCASNSHRVG